MPGFCHFDDLIPLRFNAEPLGLFGEQAGFKVNRLRTLS